MSHKSLTVSSRITQGRKKKKTGKGGKFYDKNKKENAKTGSEKQQEEYKAARKSGERNIIRKDYEFHLFACLSR